MTVSIGWLDDAVNGTEVVLLAAAIVVAVGCG
jgi:hypothetical protein